MIPANIPRNANMASRPPDLLRRRLHLVLRPGFLSHLLDLGIAHFLKDVKPPPSWEFKSLLSLQAVKL